MKALSTGYLCLRPPSKGMDLLAISLSLQVRTVSFHSLPWLSVEKWKEQRWKLSKYTKWECANGHTIIQNDGKDSHEKGIRYKQQQTATNNILLNNREKNAEINPKPQVAKANSSGLKESSQQRERKKSVNYRTPRYTLSLVCMCFFGLFFFFFFFKQQQTLFNNKNPEINPKPAGSKT